MKLSKMGLRSVKLSNLDEMYPAQDILMQTGQIKQYGSGVYAYDNIPLRVMDNIETIIKKHFDKADYIEVQMPVLQLDEIWKRSGRYNKYIDEGVMMTTESSKGLYCLAPTAEEATTIFAENRIVSHKQLPVGFYQIGMKVRNELRNRGYLLRGKEFLMFDLYTFDKDEAGMIENYKKIRNIYFEIFNELNLKAVAVAADNGSIGGKNSEEIMVLSRIGEDTVLYDDVVGSQLKSKFVEQLTQALSVVMREKKVSFGDLSLYNSDIANEMNNVLDADWKEKYGLEITDVALSDINLTENSMARVNKIDDANIFSDKNLQSGLMASASADAIKAAASNEGGAMNGFVGMNMAGQAGANLIGAVNASNNSGNANAPAGGKFCPNCGTQVGDFNFCTNCGHKLK